jgi:phosphate transport system permease protein
LSLSSTNRLLLAGLWGCALLSSAIIGVIVAFIIINAAPVLLDIGITRFFTDESWHPTIERFNLVPMLLGTLLVSCGALLLAGPSGVASAVFCQFYAPSWLATNFRRLLHVLAGVPSVVYGFWGLVVLVPLIAHVEPPGTSLLAGILVLTLMILPTVAVIADASLGQVPAQLYRGATALGASRHRVVLRIMLPAARAGLFTALGLALGRALGETMAILMVTGNVVEVPQSLFAPLRTLAANIALEMAYARDHHRAALFASGLILTLLVAVTMLLAGRLSPSETRHED